MYTGREELPLGETVNGRRTSLYLDGALTLTGAPAQFDQSAIELEAAVEVGLGIGASGTAGAVPLASASVKPWADTCGADRCPLSSLAPRM